MFRESEVMAELHRIREEHYEATKEKSLKEVLEEVSQESKLAMEKHGLGLQYAAARKIKS